MKDETMTFKVINDEGKEVECEVLFTFESDETKKNYIVYTDNTTLHYVEYKGISWGFHGLFVPTSGMNKIGEAKTGAMSFWSNANHDANGHHLYFRINGEKLERVAKRTKCAATPIRCMVDTENR